MSNAQHLSNIFFNKPRFGQAGAAQTRPGAVPQGNRSISPLNCRREIFVAASIATRPCEITVSGKQFSLCFTVSNGVLFSFKIVRRGTSTLWVDFFPPRVVFDAARPGYVEPVVEAEINTAINQFGLFPGPCIIETTALDRICPDKGGISCAFLAGTGAGFNLQEVNPRTPNAATRVEYSALVTSMRRKTGPTDANAPYQLLPEALRSKQVVLFARNRASAGTGQMAEPKPVFRHRVSGSEQMHDDRCGTLASAVAYFVPPYRHQQRLHLR